MNTTIEKPSQLPGLEPAAPPATLPPATRQPITRPPLRQPPSNGSQSNGLVAAARSTVSFSKPQPASSGHRVLLYGPGGIGKTSLASLAPGRVVFIDLEDSLAKLKLDADTVSGVETWDQLRAALQSDGWAGVNTIVIDSATKAEELAVAHTLANTLTDGKKSTSVEGYGYGKGYGFVFDTFLPILQDLDRHTRAGRNVVLICHDCTATVPNPNGEDWLRYEPRLQSPSSGKASIRLRVREWADHVLFIGYDVSVDKDGKGKGGGSRTIYPTETPSAMAKSRTCREPIVFQEGNEESIWAAIIN